MLKIEVVLAVMCFIAPATSFSDAGSPFANKVEIASNEKIMHFPNFIIK